MKKYHILGRLCIGFGVGTSIGLMVTFLISYTHGGTEVSAIPRLVELFGNTLDAFAVQSLLCALIGVGFAEAGILFLIERWNFPIKCLLHFFATSCFYLPFLWLCYAPHGALAGTLFLLANVLFTYVFSWLTSYFLTRADVRSINQKIEQMRREEE